MIPARSEQWHVRLLVCRGPVIARMVRARDTVPERPVPRRCNLRRRRDGLFSPASILRAVDLPEPLWPTIAVRLRARNVTETSLRRIEPSDVWKWVSCMARTAGRSDKSMAMNQFLGNAENPRWTRIAENGPGARYCAPGCAVTSRILMLLQWSAPRSGSSIRCCKCRLCCRRGWCR